MWGRTLGWHVGAGGVWGLGVRGLVLHFGGGVCGLADGAWAAPASRGTRRNTRNQSGNAAECASAGGWTERQDEENGEAGRGGAGNRVLLFSGETGDCHEWPNGEFRMTPAETLD